MAKPALPAVPSGMHTITVSLWFNGDCQKAIDLYQQVFGAKLLGEAVPGDDGNSILHAMIKIGDSHIMMADCWRNTPEQSPREYATAGLWLYVDNCDQVFDQARKAGCEVIMPMVDQFWGDRMGKLKDPFGHCWAIASHQWDYVGEDTWKASI